LFVSWGLPAAIGLLPLLYLIDLIVLLYIRDRGRPVAAPKDYQRAGVHLSSGYPYPRKSVFICGSSFLCLFAAIPFLLLRFYPPLLSAGPTAAAASALVAS
jgi:hypothetical protein